EVNVGGAFFERGEDDGVNQLDDRRHLGVTRQAVQIENLFALIGLFDHLDAKAFGRPTQDALRSVAFAQNGLDRAPRRHLDFERDAQLSLQFVEQHEVRRVGHRDDHVAVFAAQRHEFVPQHQIHRERLDERIIHGVIFQLNEIQAISLSQSLGHCPLGLFVLPVFDDLFWRRHSFYLLPFTFYLLPSSKMGLMGLMGLMCLLVSLSLSLSVPCLSVSVSLSLWPFLLKPRPCWPSAATAGRSPAGSFSLPPPSPPPSSSP